ncbi:MAG: hypothetical protein C4518_12330 [Desulfobacteraceae bacterium]|nr:MAG: hypothetical protein C4518_12330 [Desulfobacteraceae bacterium]
MQDPTRYLAEHGKASINVALKKATAKIQKLKAEKWLRVIAQQRTISIEKNEDALEQEGLLDGCYMIKSDVPKTTRMRKHCTTTDTAILRMWNAPSGQ